MVSGLPKATSRTRRAWSLLRRAKTFILTHQGVTYFVDRGGWAKVLDEEKGRVPPGGIAVHASKLLDPSKKGGIR